MGYNTRREGGGSMATLNAAPGTQTLRFKDTFEKPSFLEGLLVLIPGLLFGAVGAWFSLSGLVGGDEGWLGGTDGALSGVKGVLGGLMFGGVGLVIGAFLSMLILFLVSRGKRRRYWLQTVQAYLFLSPSVIILLLFTFISMVYAFYVSLHKFGLGQVAGKKAPEFVGFDNYAQAMFETGTRQSEFWKSLITTLWFTLGSIPVQVIVALVMAVLLFRKMRGVSVYRTSFFLPYVTATIAIAEVWVVLFSRGEVGIINNILEALGIARQGWLMESRGIFEIMAGAIGVQLTPPAWLPEWAHSIVLGPSQALFVIMLYSTWKYFGFSLVILLAGLGNIDPELYEAAQIDGSNVWQSFKRITIPLLSPSLYYVTLIATMGSLRSFDAIYQLSIRASAGSGPGGPLDSTQSLVIYVFNQFWRDHFFGYGSALAMILFAVILVVTLIQQRVLSRRVFYA
jgi:multiple sugar transport system permease protein